MVPISPHQPKNKNKKNVIKFGPPLTKLPGPAHVALYRMCVDSSKTPKYVSKSFFMLLSFSDSFYNNPDKSAHLVLDLIFLFCVYSCITKLSIMGGVDRGVPYPNSPLCPQFPHPLPSIPSPLAPSPLSKFSLALIKFCFCLCMYKSRSKIDFKNSLP